MQKHNMCRTAVCLAVSLALNGCSVFADKKALDKHAGVMMDSTSNRVGGDLRKVTLEQKWANQDVDLPFLASEPRPISRDSELPLVLQGKVNVTLIFPDGGEADVITLAKRVQDASGILVKVTPDALLPLSEFGPRLTEQNGRSVTPLVVAQTASANTFNIDGPIMPGAMVPETVAVSTGPHRKPSTAKQPIGELPLDVVMDKIATPLGNYWKWDPVARQIVIYRTETRIFEVRGAEMDPSGNVSVNLTGSIGETGNNSVDSKSATKIELLKSEGGQMGDIVKRITQFMTRSGKIANGMGGMIIVTDTKDALDQIQTYMDLENKVRSRSIDLTLEEIIVESSRSTQASTNWNLMFNPGGEGGNAVNVQGLNSLLEQEGAAASLGASVGKGPWAGSSVAVQALSKIGKVVGRQIDSTGSNNGVPVTIGTPERRKYIDKLEQTQSSSDNSRPTVSATQAVEVSGRIVTIVPYAYANGDANLAFKFDNTVTQKIEKNAFPDGSYVQSPWSKSTVLARAARVRSGQPYVISATVTDSRSYNANRVDPDAPMLLGGSDIADKTERVTLLVLTAMVREQ